MRVLRPGGRLVIVDIQFVRRYAEHLGQGRVEALGPGYWYGPPWVGASALRLTKLRRQRLPDVGRCEVPPADPAYASARVMGYRHARTHVGAATNPLHGGAGARGYAVAAGKGRKLVIVESPAKARTIAGYLGGDFDVEASIGHIRDLPNPSELPADMKKGPFGKFAVDVDNGFEAYYVVDPDKRKKVAELKRLLKDAGELYLATDEDREGEAIAWHLLETLKPRIPVKRMVFHEITREAIQRALAETRDLDERLVDAQETRRILDRLYGYEVSPSCGARSARACRPGGCSRWLRAWWSSASGSGWRSSRPRTGTSRPRSPRRPAASRSPPG